MSCLTLDDVFPLHPDVVVPVGAGLLVVEAQGVEQLVLDGAVVEASAAGQRHSLSAALATHGRVAAVDAQTHSGVQNSWDCKGKCWPTVEGLNCWRMRMSCELTAGVLPVP